MTIKFYLSVSLGIEFWIAIASNASNALVRGLRFASALARFVLL